MSYYAALAMTGRAHNPEEPQSIPRRPNLEEAQDFDALFERGLKRLRDVSGAVWTDHNLHDPGITILEVLCFALTDIAYRASHPIEDLIATLGTDLETLPVGAEALASSPVTDADIVSYICDRLPDVRNLWFDWPRAVGSDPKNATRTLCFTTFEENTVDKTAVLEAFSKIRPLGAGLDEVVKVQPIQISVRFNVEIEPGVDPTDLTAQLMDAIEQTINPVFRFHNPEVLGPAPDPAALYDGPALASGLVSRPPALVFAAKNLSEDEATTIPEKLAVLLQQMLGTEAGVAQVSALEVGLADGADVDFAGRRAVFTLKHDEAQINSINTFRSGAAPESRFATITGGDAGLRNGHIKASLRHRLDLIRAERSKHAIALEKLRAPYEAPWAGQKLVGLTEYQSIQQDFPAAYRLFRLSKKQFPEVAQLRGYLALFEQHLVNLVSQLEHAATLLVPQSIGNEQSLQTYRNRPLTQPEEEEPNANGFDALLRDDDEDSSRRSLYEQALQNAALQADPGFESVERAIDHALARFGIHFDTTKLAQFLPPEGDSHPDDANPSLQMAAKRAFLNEGVALSMRRGGLSKNGHAMAARRIKLLSLVGDASLAPENLDLVIIENWRFKALAEEEKRLWRLPPLRTKDDDRDALCLALTNINNDDTPIRVLLRYLPGIRISDVDDDSQIQEKFAEIVAYNILDTQDDAARLVLYTSEKTEGPIFHFLKPFSSSKAAQETANSLFKMREDIRFNRVGFPPDLFGQRITVVAKLPRGWDSEKKESLEYRRFAEDVIRANLPAHLEVDVFWSDPWPIRLRSNGFTQFGAFARAASTLAAHPLGVPLPANAGKLFKSICMLHYEALFCRDGYRVRSEIDPYVE